MKPGYLFTKNARAFSMISLSDIALCRASLCMVKKQMMNDITIYNELSCCKGSTSNIPLTYERQAAFGMILCLDTTKISHVLESHLKTFVGTPGPFSFLKQLNSLNI